MVAFIRHSDDDFIWRSNTNFDVDCYCQNDYVAGIIPVYGRIQEKVAGISIILLPLFRYICNTLSD